MKAPLFIVTGTMGAGKSTTAELLPALLPECVVFDIDWAIGSLSMVAGHPIPEHPPAWPGVNDTWLAIAAAIGRSGRPTVLLGPFGPELNDAPSFRLVGPVHWLLLDASDDTIHVRLAARSWGVDDVAGALADAAAMRARGHERVRTDQRTPEQVAEQVVRWVRGLLQ